MIPIGCVVDAALRGEWSLAQVESWVRTVRSRFDRPPIEQWREQSGEELDDLINRSSDWQIRMSELSTRLSEISRQSNSLMNTDPERAIFLLRLGHLLITLLADPAAEGDWALRLGRHLIRTERPFDAADVLVEAVEAFQKTGSDNFSEATALFHLTAALRQDKRREEALGRARELEQLAGRLGYGGYLSTALLNQGMLLAEMHRPDEAVNSLRLAVSQREQITAEVAEHQSVAPSEVFLEQLGMAYRRFGRFDDAISIFLELVEVANSREDPEGEARALSEIGYTYGQAGEVPRQAEFLERAAALAEAAGDSISAQRWRMQARLARPDFPQNGVNRRFISGQKDCSCAAASPDVSASPTSNASDQTVAVPQALARDGRTAYGQMALAETYAAKGQYEEAITFARLALDWARFAKDRDLEVSARNTLGCGYTHTDRTAEAVTELQRAIVLADFGGPRANLLPLRNNLALAYLRQGKHQAAFDAFLSGIDLAEELLAANRTTEFRQQVIANSLSLFEGAALLVSQLSSPDAQAQLAVMTERVRARNLLGWIRMSDQLEASDVAPDTRRRAGNLLRRLRTLHVENELRHFTGRVGYGEMSALLANLNRVETDVQRVFAQASLPSVSAENVGEDFAGGDIESILGGSLQPGMAIVSLFSVPEGICPVILFRRKGRIHTEGSFLPWERQQRYDVLAQATGLDSFRSGRGSVVIGSRDVAPLDSGQSPAECLLRPFRENLFNPLISQLEAIRPQTLVIVPHAELALIPYWDLVDRCASVRRMTLVPSLNVFRLCSRRRRAVRGPTVLFGDVTRTLPQADGEIAFVQDVRGDHPVLQQESFAGLYDALSQASLFHIAGHAVFNVENPYHSGVLAVRRDTTEGPFVQYASPSGSSFGLSEHAGSGSIRLLTVAECMAELSLDQCRLAVLSACHTGTSRLHGGGELTGLPAAMLVAGVKSVIASHWKVHDTATALLMRYFYGTWSGGSGTVASPAEALHIARDRLASSRPDDVKRILGPSVEIPPGDTPFATPTYTDAFHCFGDY